MLSKIKWLHAPALFVAVLYGVELLDELIGGLHSATLPYLRDDFVLTYTQVGLLSALPGLMSVIVEPALGLLGDTRHRRALVVGGISATALGLLLISVAQSYGVILSALCVLYPASGAYVNLSQATLIDRAPARAEQTMARWTLLGVIGIMTAPLLMTVLFALGGSWRGAYLALTVPAGIMIVFLFRHRFDAPAGAQAVVVSPRALGRRLMAALRRRTLLKWIVLTELADFMLDKLLEVTGLYFHDVAGVSLAGASAAIAVSTTAGLIGNGLMVPVLERVSGLRVLRATAVGTLIAYSVLLLTPIIWLKYAAIGVIGFSTSGWYAVLQAKCFEALPGQSGLVLAVTSLVNVSSLLVPVLFGSIADALGLQTAMWLLAIGPLALIVGVR